MFATHVSPSQAYARVAVETGVMSANPHRLILMLFDGALLSLAGARRALQEGEIATKGESVSKAIDIVANGLKASLDPGAGGELAPRLAALYDYICARLLHANLHNDRAALDECARLLTELRGAWEEIADDPAVVSPSARPS
ncbi:MAG: flagellar export chaperone FliS [Sulfuritalea sp.]|nr:flagellar export chaperone FliS [Sulfuritalea sp.]